MPVLPQGWTPVDVGRVGIWLLSRRSHKAAQRRIAFPSRAWVWHSDGFVKRFERLILGWRIHEYPGSAKFLAELLCISQSSAAQYLKPSWSRKLPPKHAITLATYLESRASECQALAAELKVYAKVRDGVLAHRGYGLQKWRREQAAKAAAEAEERPK